MHQTIRTRDDTYYQVEGGCFPLISVSYDVGSSAFKSNFSSLIEEGTLDDLWKPVGERGIIYIGGHSVVSDFKFNLIWTNFAQLHVTLLSILVVILWTPEGAVCRIRFIV